MSNPLTRGVAGEADDLHSVQEGPRDGVQHVGGADKQDLGGSVGWLVGFNWLVGRMVGWLAGWSGGRL